MNIFGRKNKGSKGKRKPYIKSVLLNENSPFAINEAYKAVRTNLMFMVSGSGCKTVAVTSSYAEEGKTTTCINMAITFSQTGAKTLIIDADMRKPRVHRYFHLTSSPGLSDNLGGFTEDLCINETEYNNLFILPVGTIPPSPTELLGSPRMGKLLDELSTQFDYIFIDAPPINLVTDAAIIANKINGVLIIARQGTTTVDSLKQAVASLERVGSNILGFVLNDVSSSKYTKKYRRKYKKGYGYYYGYGYGYGYGDYSDEE